MKTSNLKDLTFHLFLGISLLIIIAYLVLLYNKITRPAFEDIETDDFIWLGVLIIGLVTTDFLIVRRFIRRSKKNKTR